MEAMFNFSKKRALCPLIRLFYNNTYKVKSQPPPRKIVSDFNKKNDRQRKLSLLLAENAAALSVANMVKLTVIFLCFNPFFKFFLGGKNLMGTLYGAKLARKIIDSAGEIIVVH